MQRLRKEVLVMIASAAVIWTEPYCSTSFEMKVVLLSMVLFLACWHYFNIDSRMPLVIGMFLLLFSSLYIMDQGPASSVANQFAGYAFYFLLLGIVVHVYEYFRRRS